MLETPAQILEHDASADAVRSFIAWRKATKKPLTERAALLVAKSLREITAAGGDADEALDLAQEHGWQTIKPHWFWRIKNDGQSNGQYIAGGRADQHLVAPRSPQTGGRGQPSGIASIIARRRAAGGQ